LISKVLAVIPVYKGEPKVVIRSIRSLLSQDYPYMRIIVLDDGSKGDLLETLQNTFGIPSKITWIENESNMGFANTLNKALSLVVDETFFFILEQDCEILAKDYLTTAINQFDDPSIGVIFGENILPPTEELTTIKRVFMRHFCEDELELGVVEAGYSLLKADVFRVEALKKVGGFKSSADWKFACEEHLISYKLKSIGYKIVKDSRLRFRTYFSGQENLKQNLRKEAVYGRGFGWAVATKQSNLDSGESKQLKSKKFGRIIQTQYVTLTIFSLIIFFVLPYLGLAILLSTALILVAYLASQMFVLQSAREKLLFIATGFLRSWIYVPSFAFGFLSGLVARLHNDYSSSLKEIGNA
jgi:glycosyltransferase involved in cell wall biosynthesis